MYYNYTTIINKGELHEDYVHHLFRYSLSGQNSTFNILIEITKYDWVTVTHSEYQSDTRLISWLWGQYQGEPCGHFQTKSVPVVT